MLRRKEASLIRPVQRGVVQDWEASQQLWQYAWETGLGVEVEEHPVLMTEPPLNPLRTREKVTEIMFETFNVPAFYVSESPLLSLFASGRGSGLILSAGEGLLTTTPIAEGSSISAGVAKSEFAGCDLTSYLQALLTYSGTCVDSEEAREAKEQVCFVAADFSSEMTNAEFNSELLCSAVLPDGQHVQLRHERFLCPEALFQPEIAGKESPSFAKMPANAILACESPLKELLSMNVILAGGCTLFPGLPGRLQSELRALLPHRVRVVALPEREKSVWLGGSIFASLSSFEAMWVTRGKYQEYGAAVSWGKG